MDITNIHLELCLAMTCVNAKDIVAFVTTELKFFVEELRPLLVIQYQPNNGDKIRFTIQLAILPVLS